MPMIFYKFATEADAQKFVDHVQEKFQLKGTVDHDEEGYQAEIERPEDETYDDETAEGVPVTVNVDASDVEEKIEEMVTAFGGEFLGT